MRHARAIGLMGLALALAACHRTKGPSASGLPFPSFAIQESTPEPAPSVPPTWGGLRPGPHEVGYRMVVLDDPSRPYHLHTEPEPYPRPVVAGVWYPARPDTGQARRVGDYFELTAPRPELEAFATVASAYLRGVVVDEAMSMPAELLRPKERDRLERVLTSTTFARSEATLAVDGAPVLLAHAGLGGALADNLVLYEYLASRGWVVVAGLFQQATGNGVHVGWDPVTSLRDLDLLREGVPAELGVEPQGFAVIGHSYGAQAALVYATLPGRVDAVVSLDSTIENASAEAPWWREPTQAPWLDRATEIRVPALLFASPEPERSFFDAMGSAPRELVLAPGLDHDDFVGIAGAFGPLAGRCPSPVACRDLHTRHLTVVATAARFLDATLRPERPRDDAAVARHLAAVGFTRERVSEPAPSTPVEPLPALEPGPDCRDAGSCDPVLVAVTRAWELRALGRSQDALAELDGVLATETELAWLLHDTRGILLASRGAFVEATEAFDRSARVPGPRGRQRRRRDRAAELAGLEPRPDEPEPEPDEPEP
ncbi:MAG: hypothetical protein H6712_31820 [Myxococcales bacterium]|nr:hypothetical protein [Myxococcales bacterium]MCB9718481.1 hypothetical protein [Myxococcales bacterium]